MRIRTLSVGSRSQRGSRSPETSHRRDSVCVGSALSSASQSARQWSGAASCQFEAASASPAIVSRRAGRTSRTRSSTPPSSSIRAGAGTTSAAWPERGFAIRRVVRPAAKASDCIRNASSAVRGFSRSRRRMAQTISGGLLTRSGASLPHGHGGLHSGYDAE